MADPVDEWDTLALTTTQVGNLGDVTTVVSSPRRDRGKAPSQVLCTTYVSPSGGSLFTELRELADLLSAGQLTAAEYDVCKRVVIERFGGGGGGGGGGGPEAAAAEAPAAEAPPRHEGIAALRNASPKARPHGLSLLRASGEPRGEPPANPASQPDSAPPADPPSQPPPSESATVEPQQPPSVPADEPVAAPPSQPEPPALPPHRHEAIAALRTTSPKAKPRGLSLLRAAGFPADPPPAAPAPFDAPASAPASAPAAYDPPVAVAEPPVPPTPANPPSEAATAAGAPVSVRPSAAADSVPASLSAHLWGRLTTIRTTVSMAGGLAGVLQTVEGCLCAEAARTTPSSQCIDPKVWTDAVRVKSVQVHDGERWVDLRDARQLLAQPECHLFGQLQTGGLRPAVGDSVMLAPGHAPELVDKGCLAQGEEGRLEWDSGGGDSGPPPLLVRGPGGSCFAYYRDDVISTRRAPLAAVLPQAVPADQEVFESQPRAVVPAAPVAVPGMAAELEELQRRKAAAVAAESYDEARQLKETIDALLARQQRWAAPTCDVEQMKDRLRFGMCHAAASKDLMSVATDLHAVAPQAVYDVIGEYQPTLNPAKIARTWRKIIEIYLAHAERAEQEMRLDQQVAAVDEDRDGDALVEQIRGVISFLDSPLSPRTLRDVRQIRRNASPQRYRGPTNVL